MCSELGASFDSNGKGQSLGSPADLVDVWCVRYRALMAALIVDRKSSVSGGSSSLSLSRSHTTLVEDETEHETQSCLDGRWDLAVTADESALVLPVSQF